MSMKGNKQDIKFVLNDSLKYIKKNIKDESIQLVYLDPPFFKQKELSQYSKSAGKRHSFSDKWESREEYLSFIEEILIECKNKMKNSGLLFLHCDTSANHNLRVLLDKVFGEDMFINEIIWFYKRWSNSSSKLLDAHQTIWVYAKTKDYNFNKIMTSYSPTTNVDQILQMRERNSNGVVVYKRNLDNDIVGVDEKKGVPLRDVWEIPFLNPKAKERVGYPTQKPIELLKRIIQISCSEGDLILDPFCGSGSLGIAALVTKCSYIGIDCNEEAVNICNSRIDDYYISSSEVLNGDYSSFNNLEKEIRDFLNEINAVPIERNKGLDGIFSSNEGLVGIRFQRSKESLAETISLIRKSSYEKPLIKKIVIKTHDGDLFDCEYSDVVIIESMNYKFTKILNEANSSIKAIL